MVGLIRFEFGRFDGLSKVVEEVANEDRSAPWVVPENLHSMGPLWRKEVLPDDWKIRYASVDGLEGSSDGKYVYETYEYVSRAYTGTSWMHHMGLIWGIFFSEVAPYLCFPKDGSIRKSERSQGLTKGIRELPWVRPATKHHKGVTAPRPLLTMFTTAVIGFLDNKSPLHKHLTGHGNRLGKVWTDKHGKKN